MKNQQISSTAIEILHSLYLKHTWKIEYYRVIIEETLLKLTKKTI